MCLRDIGSRIWEFINREDVVMWFCGILGIAAIIFSILFAWQINGGGDIKVPNPDYLNGFTE